MKKLLLFVLAAVAFAACEQAPIEEAQGVVMSDRSLEVSFEGADDTRIQLQNGKTVWTEGDHVSVFYRSTINEEWQFMGKTSDRTGQIVPVDNSVNPPATHNHVVVAYPYSADYFYNTETHNVEASLPAVQNYLKDSYGTNGNIMISSSEFNKVSLKSVCGWLKLQLTGDGEVVKSITLRGNDGEQVAGLIYVDSAAATATLASASGEAGDGEVGGTLVRPGTILTEVTLDCGEGVALGKNATAFYIALPPQTFEKGFTVEIEDTEGYVMEQSTDKALTIERNTIKPMAAFEFVNPNTPSTPMPANNEIWYTATAKVEPTFDDFLTFGSDVVSNVWDSETKRGIITFDSDVTMIGDDAFNNCDKLMGVTLPESVTSIGKNAFYDCDGLTEFTIPDSVTTIGDNAFYYCSSLTSVTIGDSVTTIGEWIFYYCTSLTSVTIGNSVTTIGERAFCVCSSLTSVTIPDSVTTIGEGAFCYCDSLAEFKGKFSEDNGRMLVVDGTLVAFAPAGLTEYTIPDSVTTIGGYAFAGCSSPTSVTIPDSVTTIGNYAFSGCKSLKKVYCNATVPPSIGDFVFYDNVSGRRIYVYEECVELYKSAWSSYKDSIYTNGKNCPETITIVYTSSDGNVVTPYNTNVFGANIISNEYNNGMGVIIFDGNVTTIGEEAFYKCSSLTSVTIPDSVTTIENSAFASCTSLTSVNIPDSVTTIGESAFCDCDSLTSVNIPDSVTTIGGYAFYSCDSLTSVNIPDSVTTIGNYAFAGCTSLTSVNIPDSVTEIGDYTFFYCKSLTSVNIPDSVTEIGGYAFSWCSSLASVYCKATTPPALGPYVFSNNGSGRKIYVPTESVQAYKSATNWNEYASAIVGYDFENGVVVEPEQGPTINYTTLSVIDTWAELEQGGKQWNVTFVERYAVLGDILTVISFYMEKSNTLRVEDGTYSVANGGILVNSAVQNGFSTYRGNSSLATDIVDASFEVVADTDNHTISIVGTFQAGNDIISLNYNGAISGMDISEPTTETINITDWKQFTGKYWNGYDDDSEFMFQGRSSDNTVEFMFDCYAYPRVSDKIAPEGTYTIAPWEAKDNYQGDTLIIMDQSYITYNTIKGNLAKGTLTVTHMRGRYYIEFDFIDTLGRHFTGSYTGQLTAGSTMNNP